MWHEATRELQAAGKVQVVGIIPEQHPDRTRLFMQWKEMDWPVLLDSANLMEATRVPITLFIDEFGIIRNVRPQIEELEDFLNRTYEESTRLAQARLPDLEQLKRSTRQGTVSSWREYGDAIIL